MNAIEIKDLHKTYKDVTAIDGLTLDIREGELFSLLGVNGAGKTTTVKVLSCLSSATSGNAFVFGHSVTSEPIEVKKLINLSPQETAVAGNLTVIENLRFIAELYGCPNKKSNATAQDIIEKLHLQEVAHRKAKLLSGGWQRRLSIAMAIITNPKVLFLDEPTLGLDVLARRELWSLIESLKSSTTIILTTHYMEEAEMLSDRIGIMAKGKLLAVGTPQELIEQAQAKNFEDAFVKIATKVTE